MENDLARNSHKRNRRLFERVKTDIALMDSVKLGLHNISFYDKPEVLFLLAAASNPSPPPTAARITFVPPTA